MSNIQEREALKFLSFAAKGLVIYRAGGQGLDAAADVLAHGGAAKGQEEVELAGEVWWFD